MNVFRPFLCLTIICSGPAQSDMILIDYNTEILKVLSELDIKAPTNGEIKAARVIVEERAHHNWTIREMETERNWTIRQMETERNWTIRQMETERKWTIRQMDAERKRMEAEHNCTKVEAKEYFNRTVSAEKDRENFQKKIKEYEVPLNVRSYAAVIEDRFPHLKNYGNIPANVMYVPHNRHIFEKQYKWMTILEEGEAKKDAFVMPVAAKLNATFQKENPGIKEGSDEWIRAFKKYRLDFCDAISRACDFVNKMFAHVEAGQDVKLLKLGVFNTVVDKFMTLFYNSLLGTSIEKESYESRM